MKKNNNRKLYSSSSSSSSRMVVAVMVAPRLVCGGLGNPPFWFMCLEKAVKSRNGQRGPRILFQHFNNTQQAARKSSGSFSSRIHGYYYTIRDNSIIFFLTPHLSECSRPTKTRGELSWNPVLKRRLLVGCVDVGPASSLRSVRVISFLVGPFDVHQHIHPSIHPNFIIVVFFDFFFFFACFVFEDFLSMCLKRDPQFECTEIIFIILRLFTSRLSLTFIYLFIFVIIPCRFSLRTALVYWLEAAHKNQDRNARGRVRNAITGINNIWDHFNPGLHPSSSSY